MLKLPHFPTGNDCYVDPNKVDAMFDALTTAPPRIVGGQPELQIVGTNLLIGGTTLTIHGPLKTIAPLVERARSGAFPKLCQ